MKDFRFSINFIQFNPKIFHYPKKILKPIFYVQKCITFVTPTKKVGLI